MRPQDTLKRAFELARSGRVQTLEDLRRALKGEGYDRVEDHLSGMAIRKQLKDILAEAVNKPNMPANSLG